MDENYLTSILDCTEKCCQLLLCSLCKTLPREIVTINGQEAIVCLCCAEKEYSFGKISHVSAIRANVKYNKVLALLNRTFRALYELNESSADSKDHIEQKKEAIKEGVLTCLNLLRPSMRETQQTIPINEAKKKIIIKKKKNFDILQDDSDDDDDGGNKENQASVSVTSGEQIRRRTVRGSNTSKRPINAKPQENESPSKRSKPSEDIDVPLPIISPAVVKKPTPTRTKKDESGEEKKEKSIRLTRKQLSGQNGSAGSQTTKLVPKQDEKEKEASTATNTKPTLPNKTSVDARNDKGESLIHQAVTKGDITRVKQLINDGHSVNTIDNNSWTPLHEASSMGNIPLMEILLANNANINVPGGQEQMTVLHEALSSENTNESLIKFLLEHGADPQIKNRNGKSSLDLAKELGNPKILALFEKNQCVHTSHNDTPIAPPPRRRGRTTSAANVLFLTGFNRTRKESLIKSIQTIFGRKCVTTAKCVENNVTHIVACGETDRVVFRTINYLRGIVLGKWIVSEKWLEECIKEKRWINETDYEILGSQLEPNSNGAHRSRIKHERNEAPLFNKCQFYLYGQFHTYKKEDITDLIKVTGAVLLKREPKLHRINSDTDLNNSNESPITYILYESTIPDLLLDTNLMKHMKLIDFLACIDSYDNHERSDK